ncbi:thermonuclease family protein [Castellaniella caeni]|uniref:thermonuclease family protein n=1 Tax=Castellaniella caeni TaxID=266123 RepID=UPI0015E0ECB5|nr:thermonuclease family protein [Castellaniella caeni]
MAARFFVEPMHVFHFLRARPVRRLGALALLAGVGWLINLSLPSQARAYTITGRVVHVADGDTLTVLVGRARQRIRLASIDAPETGHGRERPGQPYGQAAKRALSALVAGKTLALTCYERDHYGRDICDVPLPDGRLVSQVMVASGMAWANRQAGGKYLRDASLPGREKSARDRRLGLWQRPGAVAPWEWRSKCWKALEVGRSSPIC